MITQRRQTYASHVDFDSVTVFMCLIPGMGSRIACSRPRPRPVVFEAKASSLRGQSQGQWSWLLKKMTLLIKIQLLNWQQNVYQSTRCSQNWASVFTSHTNMLQSQVAITFEKHKLAEEFFEPGSGARSDHSGWTLAPLVQMLLELTKLTPAVPAVSEL